MFRRIAALLIAALCAIACVTAAPPPPDGSHIELAEGRAADPVQIPGANPAEPRASRPDPSPPSPSEPSDPPDWPITPAPAGIRGGLLSPSCHGSPDPECEPAQLYVGETLALFVHTMDMGYGLRVVRQGQYEEDSQHPVCEIPFGVSGEPVPEPYGIQDYRIAMNRGDGFEFHWYKTCGEGSFTVQLDRPDGAVAQYHAEVLPMPDGITQHPLIPTPTPTLSPVQVRKVEDLERRFHRVSDKLSDQTFQQAIFAVSLSCPAYATSKLFEIKEKLDEKHHAAGLFHVLEAAERGESSATLWTMVEHDHALAEDYIEIREWGYDELSKMIKKPSSFMGCE